MACVSSQPLDARTGGTKTRTVDEVVERRSKECDAIGAQGLVTVGAGDDSLGFLIWDLLLAKGHLGHVAKLATLLFGGPRPLPHLVRPRK